MNKYIFYTFEGFTQSPNGDDVENLQILGFESASTKDEALHNLLNNNDWIMETGFKLEEIICKKLAE